MASSWPAFGLPLHQPPCGALWEYQLWPFASRRFISTFAAVKRAEFATFMRVISPWEREFLLLNV